jgi:hypothetical protein
MEQSMSEEKQDSPSFGKLDGILPEFYYDLISRILPGALLIGGVIFFSGKIDSARALKLVLSLTSTAAFVILVVCGTAAYVLGILLSVFHRGIRWLYIPGVWRPLLVRYAGLIKERQQELGLSHSDELFPDAVGPAAKRSLLARGKSRRIANAAVRSLVQPLYSPLHDFLKTRDPQARLVLPKMSAETSLCDNLVVISLIISVIPLYRLMKAWPVAAPVSQSSEIRTLLALWFISILCFVVARYRYAGLIQRHFAYWSILPKNKVSNRKDR